MAHYEPTEGLGHLVGALSKRNTKEPFTTTRRKRIKDPITGEVVGYGPKEIYIQRPRDLDEHPYTENEKRSHGNWRTICREAPAILRDKSHPRYMELYQRWREHVQSTVEPMKFPNFVRHILATE